MRAVVLVSGGLDSSTLLHHLVYQKIPCKAMTVDYGQRHKREMYSAAAICENLFIPLTVVRLNELAGFMKGSSQTSPSIPVPEGHYADETMKVTVVPNRNMVLLSLAAAWAISNKFDTVAYAAHAGDHPIYPDCRPAFIDAMNHALLLCNEPGICLHTPFSVYTKADIVRLGVEIDVPYKLTYSCYKGGIFHCGKCGTCVERREAFQLAGVPDPTEYES